jgi:hypothetical protein
MCSYVTFFLCDFVSFDFFFYFLYIFTDYVFADIPCSQQVQVSLAVLALLPLRLALRETRKEVVVGRDLVQRTRRHVARWLTTTISTT